MQTFRVTRCQLVATVLLVCAAVPFAGIAQEQELNETSATPQASPKRFVSDKLVLNVYAEPDQSSARIATIQTGDVVEELERSGNLVRVRLQSGPEGWVGASYLTSDEPAAVRLRQIEREQKTAARGGEKEKELAAEIAALKNESATLKKANAALRVQIDELQSTVSAPAAETTQIMTAHAADVVQQPGVAAAGRGPWAWLTIVILAGALGFAGGYQTLARRLRRKFGGLKIY